ncbi:MAG: hypothetical protein Q7U04_16220 [Bacteriovorax sp.]|nr:hypothetical protein [Bacteriovorax sp.]
MFKNISSFFGCMFMTNNYHKRTSDKRIEVIRRIKLSVGVCKGMRKTSGIGASMALAIPREIYLMLNNAELTELLELHDIATINNKTHDPFAWVVYCPSIINISIDMNQTAIKELRKFEFFRIRSSIRNFNDHSFINPSTAKIES